MLALTPVPGLSSSERSPWISPTRAESVQMLRRDISELNDAWKGEIFAAQSSELLSKIKELKQQREGNAKRENAVMRRFAAASREGFRLYFEEERAAAKAQRIASHNRHLRTIEQRRQQRAVEQDALVRLASIAAEEHKRGVDEAAGERHGIFAQEMADHQGAVRKSQAHMQDLNARIMKAVTISEHTSAVTSVRAALDEEMSGAVRREEIERERLMAAENHHAHEIARCERKGRDQALRRVARRLKTEAAAQLVHAQQQAAARAAVLDTEIDYRGALLKSELHSFAEIQRTFQLHYEEYTEMSRRHHAELLSAKRREAQDRQRTLANKANMSGAERRRASEQRKANQQRAAVQERVDAALNEREQRLWFVREAQAERVAASFASRMQHLEALASNRLAPGGGHSTPSRWPLERHREGGGGAHARPLHDIAPGPLRDQIISMIRDL